VLWLFFIRQMQGGSNKAFSFGKSKAKLINMDKPTITFEDVAGCDEAKVELQEIIEFLREPQKFQKLGGKIPKGVLPPVPPGVAAGLAWTQAGGEVIYIEATLLPEGKGLTLTGQLGDVMSLYAYFNTGNIWYREREPGMSLPEYHFHNWFHVDWLCGDHIVEQHVHNLDFCNWIMQGHPVRAYGMGGRQYHTDRGGNIYDHFTIEYEYANGVRLTSMCRQIEGTDKKIGEEIVGTKGHGMIVSRKTQITGENAKVFREHPNQHESHGQEHIDFVAALRRGETPNDTRFLCESTLTAIMGRESAYTGKNITWDQILNSDLQLTPPDIAAWDGTIRPVPKPGMPRV